MEAILEDPLGVYDNIRVTLSQNARYFEVPEVVGANHTFSGQLLLRTIIIHVFERTNRFKNDRRVYLRVQKSDIES